MKSKEEGGREVINFFFGENEAPAREVFEKGWDGRQDMKLSSRRRSLPLLASGAFVLVLLLLPSSAECQRAPKSQGPSWWSRLVCRGAKESGKF